jgi:hypothetical protein
MQNQAAKSKSAKPPRRAVALARDGKLRVWLLVRWRASGRLGLAVAFRARGTISIGTWATVAFYAGLAVGGFRAAVTLSSGFALGRFGTAIPFSGGPTGFVLFARSGRAAEVALAGGTAHIATFAAGIWATLHRGLHAPARSHAGDHAAQTLDGLLGQLLAHLREGAGAGDGGLGFKLGGLHDLLADEALVWLIGHRGLGDLAAEAHGALADFAHDVLVGLEETPERGALVVVQVAEEFLWVELALGLAALAFAGAELAALAVGWAGFAAFATRSIVAAGLGRARFATRVFPGAGLTARRALAFGGAFFPRSIFAGTLIAGAFLGDARAGQGGEGEAAQRCEERAGDKWQFHSFIRCARRWCARPGLVGSTRQPGNSSRQQ